MPIGDFIEDRWDKIVDTISKLGFPIVVTLILLQTILVPIRDGHLEFLSSQVKTGISLSETTKKISEAISVESIMLVELKETMKRIEINTDPRVPRATYERPAPNYSNTPPGSGG